MWEQLIKLFATIFILILCTLFVVFLPYMSIYLFSTSPSHPVGGTGIVIIMVIMALFIIWLVIKRQSR